MKHPIEKIGPLSFYVDEAKKHDVIYVESRVVSESIIPEIAKSLRTINEGAHNSTLVIKDNIKDTIHSNAHTSLCALAPSILESYKEISVEITPGRHLVIKGNKERFGRVVEG